MTYHEWRLVATEPLKTPALEYPIDCSEIVVGRGASAGLRLAAKSVSQEHARLTLGDGVLRVEDLNSRNGVFVNGERLEEVRQLRAGDIVNFATEGFQVETSQPKSNGGSTCETPLLGLQLANEVERREKAERLLDETQCRLTQSHAEAEKARLDAERLRSFGAILDESDNEIYIIDSETLRFVHVSRGACKNLGYSMQQLRTMTPADLTPEYDLSSFQQAVEPLREKSKNTVKFSTRHRRNDGSLYLIDAHLHLSDFEGRSAFVAVVLDTTEREKANEEIRKLSAAVDQSPSSVVITDVDWNISYVNAMFCQTTGYKKREALQLDVSEFLGGKRSGDKYDAILARVERGDTWQGEFQTEKMRGESIWVSASISPIRSASEEITHYLFMFEDITDKKALLDQMQSLAFNDSLTQLPNRNKILDAIQETIDQGDDCRYGLLFLDFDRFKLINDSLGHEMGDELLRQIAERLRANLRKTDECVPARLGGDEFVVLLKGLPDPTVPFIVAERLSKAFKQSYQLGGNTVHSTASIGVVSGSSEYRSANEVLRDADLAMYEAKSQGKGRCVAFDRTMRERAQDRLTLECDLRQGLAQDELVLEYQPIVSLESGELRGVESLVRWHHPEMGVVGPDRFIPIAEETGLIVEIGERVLEEACRQFREWLESPGLDAPPCVHVNVSRLQMLLPDFAEIVGKLLDRYDIPTGCLHLEVTESTIMHDPTVIVRTLQELRDLGVCIDMDDFGTGYSSLSCLHEFPIDTLKIDRSFVNNDRHICDYTTLLQSIVTLAENLGLEVVAEGVETAEQLATLQALGCKLGQGYYFSKPLAPADLEKFLNRGDRPVGEAIGWNTPVANY